MDIELEKKNTKIYNTKRKMLCTAYVREVEQRVFRFAVTMDFQISVGGGGEGGDNVQAAISGE